MLMHIHDRIVGVFPFEGIDDRPMSRDRIFVVFGLAESLVSVGLESLGQDIADADQQGILRTFKDDLVEHLVVFRHPVHIIVSDGLFKLLFTFLQPFDVSFVVLLDEQSYCQSLNGDTDLHEIS